MFKSRKKQDSRKSKWMEKSGRKLRSQRVREVAKMVYLVKWVNTYPYTEFIFCECPLRSEDCTELGTMSKTKLMTEWDLKKQRWTLPEVNPLREIFVSIYRARAEIRTVTFVCVIVRAVGLCLMINPISKRRDLGDWGKQWQWTGGSSWWNGRRGQRM